MPGTLKYFRKKFPKAIQSVLQSVIDPYWANVVLAMHMDDMTDIKGHTIGTSSSPVISTANPKFGSGCLVSSNGFLTSISTDYNLGTGDFTIDGWFRVTSVAGDQGVFHIGPSFSPAGAGLSFGILHGGANFFVRHDNTYEMVPYSFVLNQWYYFSLTRLNNNLKMYLNGISVMSISNSTNFTDSYLMIGSEYGSSWPLQGAIDDFRITKGVARYISNFSISSSPFGDWNTVDYYWDNTVFLCHGGDLVDKKSTAITNYGVTSSTTTRKFNTSSMAFAGSQYAAVTNQNFNFGTSDYTVEAWVYPTTSTNGMIFDSRGTSLKGICIQQTYSNVICYEDNNGSTGNVMGGMLNTNTWNHVAVTRKGTLWNLFINGVLVSSNTSSTNLSNTTARIGYANWNAQYFTGYIEDLRVTNGVARYTQNFNVPTKAFSDLSTDLQYDPYWQQTAMLLHMEGADGSYSVIDAKGNSVANEYYYNGNFVTGPQGNHISSWPKSGSTSLYVRPDIASRLSFQDISFSTQDFTVECWTYPTTVSAGVYGILFGNITVNTQLGIVKQDGTVGYFSHFASEHYTASGKVTFNVWNHIAIVRKNSIVTTYVNGVPVLSVTDSSSISINKINGWDSAGYSVCGYLDEVRITKGVARYSANFIPPNYKFQDQ